MRDGSTVVLIISTTCDPSETNATNEINDIPVPPFPHASRRPWTAEACCRLPGASPLARHHSSPLPTSPPPPHNPGIARRRTRATQHALVPSVQAAAGSGLLSELQLSLRTECACQPSKQAPRRNKPAEGLGLRKPAAAFPEPARWPGTPQALHPTSPPKPHSLSPPDP